MNDAIPVNAKPAQYKGPELSAVENTFLSTLKGAHNIGAVDGTAYKLFDQVVMNGRTHPVTEADFTTDEHSAIKNLVNNKIAKTGKTSGHIDYTDYTGGNTRIASRSKAEGEVLNTLGGFDYKKHEDGSIEITDSYGFNTNRGEPVTSETMKALFAVLSPRDFAASIGRKIVPKDKDHPGLPVRLLLK